MYVAASLLYLQIVSSFAAKQGDFGILRACKINNSLRLTCLYAECTGSPPFHCHLSSADHPPFSTDKCNLTIPNHVLTYANTTTRYNCTLTRRGRVENKSITVDHSIKNRKGRIRSCNGGAYTAWNSVLLCLWPLTLMMWTVL